MTSHPNARLSVLSDVPHIVVRPGTLESCDFLDAAQIDAIAVGVGAPVAGDDELQPRAGTVHASLRYRIDLAELATRARFTAQAGKVHIIDLPITHGGTGAILPWQGLPLRIVLVGVGTGSNDDLRTAGAAVARSTKGLGKVITTVTAVSDDQATEHFVEGYCLGAYPGWNMKQKPAQQAAEELILLGQNSPESVERARQHSALTWLSRDLATVPSNIKNPTWLAEQFERLGKNAGITVKRIRGKELAAQGFGGIVAVGQGSPHGPEFVIASYVPATLQPAKVGATKAGAAKTSAAKPDLGAGHKAKRGAGAKHIAIVGKGITFDTGGISIKRPRETMVTMKTDMTGAADAFAAVLGAAASGLEHRVTALLPLAENHFGENSTRPSDVVTAYDGTTIEIANTDAEGRVVMADAIAYAVKELKVDAIIDVATLTGAAAMSLGYSHAALIGNDDALLRDLQNAAEVTGEPLWHMPLVREYDSALDSTVADIRNIPQVPAGAGAIVAALFLERFVGTTPWAHLDIAGPSHRERPHNEANKGPTGFGARVITRYLESL